MSVTNAVVPDQAVQEILSLYERGLYLQAYELSQQFGEMKDWQGPAARMLASRLVVNLGAPRLSLWHRLKAWRETPGDPEVKYYYAWTILSYDGPYDTWLFMKDQGDLPAASDDIRSSWFALKSEVAALLRDFDLADEWLERALDAGENLPWVHVAKAGILESQDKHEEALAATGDALALQPYFRPAVQSRSHLLMQLERDDEAFEFLQSAAENIECGALHWQIAGIHFEREEYDLARKALDGFEAESPLLERSFGQAFHSLRSFLSYLAGDDEMAIQSARRAGGEDSAETIKMLSDPARKELPRVTLPVGFTRQHHSTCGPATLATVTRFWSMPADHLEVAEEICYNGTSAYAERKWATDNGWAVREFTVGQQSTQDVIDAGIPFTLTTTEATSAHLQAVVGYDARRRSVIIRDPSLRHRVEGKFDKFLERYRAYGPRGLAMVPLGERERLDSLELPDAKVWDEIHRVDAALTEHRRDEAAEIIASMESRWPDHCQTLHTRRRLAIYDANPSDELAVLEKLLQQFPDNEALQLARMSLLRDLERREERLRALRELTEKREAHPAFLLPYAQELAQDAREHDQAKLLLRKAIRKSPAEPGAYFVLGNLLWDEQDFETPLELYRFAACLDEQNEQLAERYFHAAQHTRQSEDVLDWLRQRFERFGANSSWPARTLEMVLRLLERTNEAIDVIEQALVLRPDDGELILYAAGALATASSQHEQRARQLTEQARGKCPEVQWLRGMGQLAWHSGDLNEALRLFREVAELHPLSAGAHHSVAQLLAETESHQAASDYLREVVERFPHYQPLMEVWVSWLHDEPETLEPVLRRLIELNPANDWAVRELGFLLVTQRRYDEAAQCAEEAGRLDPTHGAYHHLRAEILEAQGKLAEARAEYREAVRLSVDNMHAIAELIDCCDTVQQRKEELEFVREELVRQVIFGDGLLAYRSLAQDVLDPEELLAGLKEALAAREDLWHAWSACVQQLVFMEQLDEAHRVATEATEHFPLLPRIWMDLAEVCLARRDIDGQQAALETAHHINPSWGEAIRALSEIYQRRDDWEKARSLLESAVARDPLDAMNRGFLAEVLWQQDQHDEALEQLEKAVNIAPGYRWAWEQLRQWSEIAQRPDLPEKTARELAENKPGETRSWLILAQVLDGEERVDECLEALDKAVELNPRCVEAHDEKARLLTLTGRLDEAVAACRPTHVWQDPPAELVAREAWIQWSQGNRDQAVQTMHTALEADPGLAFGWQMLADWMCELEDDEGYLQAARQLVRLDPYNAVNLGYCAEAMLKTDRREEAKETFSRAFEIDPNYFFAGIHVFDMQLEDNQLDEAAQTVETLLDAETGLPYSQSRAVELAAKRNDLATATDFVRQMCLSPGEDLSPLSTAFDAMSEAGWSAQAEQTFEEMLDNPETDKEVGCFWGYVQSERGHSPDATRMQQLVAKGPIGETLVHGWIEGTLREGQVEPVRRFIKHNSNWLRDNTQTWGTVSFALSAMRDWPQTLKWTSDWRSREDAESWMLVNAAEALRASGKDAEATEVSHHALSLEPDNGHPLHQLWLACDDIVAGRYEQAAESLESVDMETLDDDYAILHMLATMGVEAVCLDPAAQANEFKAIRQTIDEVMREYPHLQAEPARRRFYKFVVSHVARQSRSISAKLWAFWRKLKS